MNINAPCPSSRLVNERQQLRKKKDFGCRKEGNHPKIGETERSKAREETEMNVKHGKKKRRKRENIPQHTHNINVTRVVVGSIA